MRILSFKPGHDGAIAELDDGRLTLSLEAEKDSYPRYDPMHPELLLDAAAWSSGPPDVVAIGGWVKGWHSVERPAQAGYYGHAEALVRTARVPFFGRTVEQFSSTHERSHIFCTYGMSPLPNGAPCYVLIWEGNLGDFYELDDRLHITHLGHVLTDPGNKYAFLFGLADPSYPLDTSPLRFNDAGKLMALAGFSDRSPMTADERRITDHLLAKEGILLSTRKRELAWSPFFDIGVQSQAFKNLAGKFSDALFARFHDFARRQLTKGLPLLIAGGCGLNCEWSTRWRETGLFSQVFVPPCANDSGSAIGTAVDAQRHYTGNAKIAWSVYAGLAFVEDVEVDPARFEVEPLDPDRVAGLLVEGAVLGWVQGRYEIGPRALGNRSLLARPFDPAMRDRLNKIKEREDYRPIAPVCLEEDAGVHFDCAQPSPHMLYFQRVRARELVAVTHVDGTARVQTVNASENPALHRLLRAFRARTGFGVLCNTSLNFKGRGFINRTSDLVEYCLAQSLDGFAIGDRLYLRRRSGNA